MTVDNTVGNIVEGLDMSCSCDDDDGVRTSPKSVGSATNGKDDYVIVNGDGDHPAESNGMGVNVAESKGSFVNGIKPNGEINENGVVVGNGNGDCNGDHELVSSEDHVEKVVESNAGVESVVSPSSVGDNCSSNNCEGDHESEDQVKEEEEEEVCESNAGDESDVSPSVDEGVREESDIRPVSEVGQVENQVEAEAVVESIGGDAAVDSVDAHPVGDEGVSSDAQDEVENEVDAPCVDDNNNNNKIRSGDRSSDVQETPQVDVLETPQVEVQSEVDAPCVDNLDGDDNTRSVADEGNNTDAQQRPPQDEVGAPSIDNVDGDDNSSDEQQLSHAEDKNGEVVVESEPQEVEVREEAAQAQEEDGSQGDEPQRVEDEVKKVEVVEESSEVLVAESEVVDDGVTEVKAVEADVNQPLEDRSTDGQQPDGDAMASPGPESLESERVDAVDNGSTLDGETDVKVSTNCHQQNLQTVDGPVKESDSVEAEEQGDVDPVVVEESQDLGSENSDAAGCELDQADSVEIKVEVASHVIAGAEDTPVSQDLSSDVDVADNLTDLESVASLTQFEEAANQVNLVVEEPVSTSDGQSDQSKTETTSLAGESTGALVTEIQSDKTDTPVAVAVAEPEPEIGGEVESELKVEIEESQETSATEDIHQNKEAEQTESVEVIDREVPSEDLSAQQTETIEDASAPLELPSTSGTAVEEEENSVGASVGDGGVVDSLVDESQTVPESADPSDTAGSSHRCEDSNTIAPVETTADSDTTKELTAPSFVADDSPSGSTGDTNSELKSESRTDPLQYPVSSSKSGSEAVRKSNHVSDSILANIRFGSFDSPRPRWGDDDCPASGPSKESTRSGTQSSNVVAATPKFKVVPSKGLFKRNAQANRSLFTGGLNRDTTRAQVPLKRSDKVSETKVERYLIKMPRKDVDFREQIDKSKVLLEEKIREEKTARDEFYKVKDSRNRLKTASDRARSDEKAARQLKSEKRREIDSVQSLIKLALRVEQINTEVHSMRKYMEHSTVDIKVEKKMLLDIRRMEIERDQLCGNSRRQQELKQALDQRVQNEEKLKVLREEFNCLRDNYSVVEERVQAAQQKLNQENRLLDELKKQWTSAEGIREEADKHVQKLNEMKDEDFLKSKNDIWVAYDLIGAGDMDKLERHCVNQVEEFMERWNKSDEFRKEYVRCNEESRLYNCLTLDGRECNPDEKPSSLPTVHVDRVNASSKGNSVPSTSTSERGFPIAAKNSDSESSNKIVEEKKKTGPAKKNKEASKINLAKVSGRTEIEEENEEPKLTEEDIELARKAEQLRAEQEAEKTARLEEQRKLEQKLRSQEGMENKRKKNEEAEAKAKIKAQKDAEQREKVRAKRAKKKERMKEKKKGIDVEVNEAEPVQPAEPSSETVTEPEVTEKPVTVAKKPQKAPWRSRQVKTTTSIPPSVRRSKRGFLRHWVWYMWVVLFIVVAAILALR